MRAWLDGSIATVNARDIWHIQVNKEGQWGIENNQLGNAVPVIGGVLFYVKEDAKSDGVAAWDLPDPNARTSTQDAFATDKLPNFIVTRKADPKSGAIAFGSDSFPFSPVVVDVEPLASALDPAPPDGAKGPAPRVKAHVKLTIDTEGKGGSL